MTANPSDAARDLDSDPEHDALSPNDQAGPVGPAGPVGSAGSDHPAGSDHSADLADDHRSAAEIAEAREERSVDAGPNASADPDRRPTIPAVPKWVVPAVAAGVVFFLLAFPFGWSVWAAIIGGLAAGAVSYAFVFRL